MEWIARLNDSLTYIEENLTEEIEVEKLAQMVQCSSSHYQRMFSFIVGTSLSEYVRKRKLSQAAFELLNSEIKVLDLAVKYGYRSSDAFSRAFFQLNGVTPSQAKKQGESLMTFPAISFQLSVKGAVPMKYRIEEHDGFKAVGIKEILSFENGANFKRIPQMWQEAFSGPVFGEIEAFSNAEPKGVLGICAGFSGNQMDYWIATPSTLDAIEGMDSLEIPKATWAIFECRGPMPAAIQEMTQRIYSEWFPTSSYEHTGGPEFEWYSDDDDQSPNFLSEIWVPVRKK